MKHKGDKNKEVKAMYIMYPCSGFLADVETLLQKFVASKSIRYEQFARIWRESNFSLIHIGRAGIREKREFLEEAFKLLLKYILPPYNLQVRVGGLYAMYAMYYTQRLDVPVRIRIPLSCWSDFCDLKQEVTNQKHLDALYIMRKLFSERVFQICAYPTMLSVDELYLHEEDDPDKKSGNFSSRNFISEWGDGQSLLTQLLDEDNIGQLHAVHEKYHQLKCDFNAQRGGSADTPGSSLDLIKPNIAQTIIDSVKPVPPSQSSDSSADEITTERAQTLKSIKKRAQSNTVATSSRSLRYLNAPSPEQTATDENPNGFKGRRPGRPYAKVDPGKRAILPKKKKEVKKVGASPAKRRERKRSSDYTTSSSDGSPLPKRRVSSYESDDEYEPTCEISKPERRRVPSRASTTPRRGRTPSADSASRGPRERKKSESKRKCATPKKVTSGSDSGSNSSSAKKAAKLLKSRDEESSLDEEQQQEESSGNKSGNEMLVSDVPTLKQSEKIKIAPNDFVALRPTRKLVDRPLIGRVVGLKGDRNVEIIWYRGTYTMIWQQLTTGGKEGKDGKIVRQVIRRSQIILAGFELTRCLKLPSKIRRKLKHMYSILDQ